MKVHLGTDHAGFEFKEKIKQFLVELGHEPVDHGAFSYDKDDDYPDFIRPAAEGVANNPGSMGIIIGGTGFGEAMCANRVKGARSMVFYGPMLSQGAVDAEGRQSSDPYELIKLSRTHNNANIISLGMRFLTQDQAKEAIQKFLEISFPGDERHARRVSKLDQ